MSSFPTHAPDPPPAWLGATLAELRDRERFLGIGSRAAAVAARLLAALEAGTDDLDGPHRPRGHAVPAADVRVTTRGGLKLEWSLGARSAIALVGRRGDLVWRTWDGTDASETRVPAGDPRGYELGRRALGWLLERPGGTRP